MPTLKGNGFSRPSPHSPRTTVRSTRAAAGGTMEGKMQVTIKAFLLVFLLTCYGCATTTFLPTDESATYAPTESLKVYWEKPQEPYTIIGRVAAEGDDIDEETLFKELKQRAKLVGAHAIIMGDMSQHRSVIGTPMSGGGTLIVPTSSNRIDAIAIRFAD